VILQKDVENQEAMLPFIKDYKQSLLASMPASFKDDTKHKVAFQDVKVFHYSIRHKG
jgi:hypothetical protein